MEQARQRRHHRERHHQIAEGLAVLHRRHHQRPQHADADERDDAQHAQHEGRGERAFPACTGRAARPARRGQGKAPVGLEIVGLGGSAGATASRSGRAVVEDQVGEGRPGGADCSAISRGIDAAARHQRGVRAGLGDAAVVEDEDAVGVDHARQAMREDQRRAALHEPVERLLDHRLVLGVHRRERLVEHQDRRVAQQRAGDGDALALAAREPDAALADDASA